VFVASAAAAAAKKKKRNEKSNKLNETINDEKILDF
jgi:hypothetical protein